MQGRGGGLGWIIPYLKLRFALQETAVTPGHSVSCVVEPCPPEAAVCLLDGSKPVNLGRVRDGPQWTGGVIVLKYVDGDLCPDKIRKRSTIIRFTCSDNQVVSVGP